VFGAVLEYVIVRLYSESNLAKQEKQGEAIDIEMMPLKLDVSCARFKLDVMKT